MENVAPEHLENGQEAQSRKSGLEMPDVLVVENVLKTIRKRAENDHTHGDADNRCKWSRASASGRLGRKRLENGVRFEQRLGQRKRVENATVF